MTYEQFKKDIEDFNTIWADNLAIHRIAPRVYHFGRKTGTKVGIPVDITILSGKSLLECQMYLQGYKDATEKNKPKIQTGPTEQQIERAKKHIQEYCNDQKPIYFREIQFPENDLVCIRTDFCEYREFQQAIYAFVYW